MRTLVYLIPRILCITNLSLLAFCGAFRSRQVLPVFCQKVSLKSLAYANLGLPHIENPLYNKPFSPRFLRGFPFATSASCILSKSFFEIIGLCEPWCTSHRESFV